MIPSPDVKKEDIDKMLLEAEIADLEAYCKSEGFTKAQTEMFIKNTLEAEEEARAAESRKICGE